MISFHVLFTKLSEFKEVVSLKKKKMFGGQGDGPMAKSTGPEAQVSCSASERPYTEAEELAYKKKKKNGVAEKAAEAPSRGH